MICHRTLSLPPFTYSTHVVSNEEAARLRAQSGPQPCLGSNCALWVATTDEMGGCADNKQGQAWADPALPAKVYEPGPIVPAPLNWTDAGGTVYEYANPQVGDTPLADWVGKRVCIPRQAGVGLVTAVTNEGKLVIEIESTPSITPSVIHRWPHEVTRLTSRISEANTFSAPIGRTAPVSATHTVGGLSSPAECTAIRQQLGPLLSIPNEPDSAAVMVRRFVNKTDGYTAGVREYGRVPNASPDWLEGYEEGTDDRAALVAARRQNQGSAASKADLDAARLALGNSAVWVDGVVDVAKSIEAILVRSAARIDREEAATLAATLPLGDNWEKDALAGAKHAQQLIAAALRPSPEGGTGANRG